MIDYKLYEYMEELLKRTPLEFIRYKYDEINWDSRLIGIVKDDIETGHGIIIPLWYFGMNY